MTNDEIMSALRDLTRPDHTLDAHIALAVYGWTLHKDHDPAEGYFAFWMGEENLSYCSNTSKWPDYTGSILDSFNFAHAQRLWVVENMGQAPDRSWSVSLLRTDLKGYAFSNNRPLLTLALTTAAFEAFIIQ